LHGETNTSHPSHKWPGGPRKKTHSTAEEPCFKTCLRCRRRCSSLGNSFSSFILSVRFSTPTDVCSFFRFPFQSPPASSSKRFSAVSFSCCGTFTRPRLFTSRGTRRRTEIQSQLSEQVFYLQVLSIAVLNGIKILVMCSIYHIQ